MNEYQLRKVLESGGNLDPYVNQDASGGVNQRFNGRALADNEFVLLNNVDISVPGKRKKRLGPANPLLPIYVSGGPTIASYNVTNMIPFAVNGTALLLATCAYNATSGTGPGVYVTNGLTFTQLTGASPNITSYCVMTTGGNYVNSPFTGESIAYIIDNNGNLFATDGNTLAPINLLDVSNNPIGSLQDMTWFMNQMFYVSGDFMWFSNFNQPTTIQNAAINVAIGDGANLRRVFPYRDGLLILFKYPMGAGQGSIHLCDVSSGTPAQYQLNTFPFFDNLNLCSPRCVCRMGFDQNAEIVFATIEGLRTDAFTDLDRLVTPSLPFSQNIPDFVNSLNPDALDNNFCILWNDELLWFACQDGYTTPNVVAAYQTKVPKQNILQGWTFMDSETTGNGYLNMAATCACVGSINGNPPALLFACPGQFPASPPFPQIYLATGFTGGYAINGNFLAAGVFNGLPYYVGPVPWILYYKGSDASWYLGADLAVSQPILASSGGTTSGDWTTYSGGMSVDGGLSVTTPPGSQFFYGPIRQAFYQDNGNTYTAISKRVDHGIPLNEKLGLRLGVMLDTDHVGPFTMQMNFDDGTSETVGTYTPPAGLTLPVNLPVNMPGLTEYTALFDLHFDALNGDLKRYKDAEVQETSTSLPSILGWYLQSAAVPVRWQDLNAPIPAYNETATAVEPETVKAGALAWE